MDQNKLNEQKMKEIAEKVYAEKTLKAKYSVSQVPFHTHNGTDSTRINEKDMVHNVRNITQIVADSSETLILRNIPNISGISFTGFAANNAGGGSATKRLVITGNARFGRCYVLTGEGSSISVDTNVQGTPLIQASNYMFSNVTGPVFTVGIGPYLAYGTEAGAVKAVIDIESYNNGSIILSVTLDTGWRMEGNLIFY